MKVEFSDIKQLDLETETAVIPMINDGSPLDLYSGFYGGIDYVDYFNEAETFSREIGKWYLENADKRPETGLIPLGAVIAIRSRDIRIPSVIFAATGGWKNRKKNTVVIKREHVQRSLVNMYEILKDNNLESISFPLIKELHAEFTTFDYVEDIITKLSGNPYRPSRIVFSIDDAFAFKGLKPNLERFIDRLVT